MKRFKNILVVYDFQVGAEEVLERARDLALANGARLTVAEVVQRAAGDAMTFLLPPSDTISKRDARLLDERRARLERIVSSLRDGGIDVDGMLLDGNPSLEITKSVLRHGYDMVMAVVEPPSRFRRMAFGSRSMHLMRKCPCPVWIMKPHEEGRKYRRLLAAVDPTATGDASNELDRKVIELASSLARVEGCRLDILSAWELLGDDYDSYRCEAGPGNREEVVGRVRGERETAVNDLLGPIDMTGIDFGVHFPKGHPSVAVPEFTRDNDVDLIVMGTVKQTRIAGWLMGNTAEDVLQSVDCSVLTVKPEGFETPIRLSGSEMPVVARAVIAGR